jgi:protoporphyrin/coproporphyrin ferrochelatase
MAEERASDTGVLLVNLGTPDAPTPGAVRRYLRQFLSDPRVVELPRLVWLPILYLFVLTFRPARTAKKYAKVWLKDGSPLRVYHERQGQLLRGYLGQKTKRLVPVVAAMRYGKLSVADGMAQLREKGVRRMIVLPMYPQYAASTTESVRDAVDKALRKWRPEPQVEFVEDFHDHPAFAKAVAKNVGEYWLKHGRPDRLLMSFHGLPQRAIDRGDPYQAQCLTSARLIATELGWNDARTLVTFQSRFGAAKWIGPATDETLAALGREGVGRVDVICPGFAADCLETLEEISIEGRETFLEAGGKDFHYIPTTNDTPAWMTALSILAIEKIERRQP